MARNGGAGSQTHTCRSRTTSASSASRVHWTIDNRYVQNIYCKQYNSHVYKDNPMKTRVHYSQTADVCSTITSTTTWTNKPRTTSASQVHQTMDMYIVQPTYHQHIITNNQADDQKCKSRILNEYNSYSNNRQHQYNHKNNHEENRCHKTTTKQSILMVTTSASYNTHQYHQSSSV